MKKPPRRSWLQLMDQPRDTQLLKVLFLHQVPVLTEPCLSLPHPMNGLMGRTGTGPRLFCFVITSRLSHVPYCFKTHDPALSHAFWDTFWWPASEWVLNTYKIEAHPTPPFLSFQLAKRWYLPYGFHACDQQPINSRKQKDLFAKK